MDYLLSGATMRLPSLDIEVNILFDEKGIHCVPLFQLCQILQLDAGYELRRLRHIMLGHQVRCLPFRQHERSYVALCLDFPLGVTYWLGIVQSRVKDPQRREQIHELTEFGLKLSAKAQKLVETAFLLGRRRMHALNLLLVDAAEILENIHAFQDRIPLTMQPMLATLEEQFEALAQPARAFIRGWLESIGQLPVADIITMKADGTVDSDAPPETMTLLASISDADEYQLGEYEYRFKAWFKSLKTWVADWKASMGGAA